jgi:hypothetical protein
MGRRSIFGAVVKYPKMVYTIIGLLVFHATFLTHHAHPAIQRDAKCASYAKYNDGTLLIELVA